jgi:MATE family multidrug resistance protein
MSSIISTYRKSFQQTIKLALPIIAGQLGHILMGFFDTVQIGGLDAQYIAATGIANTIYWFVTLLGLGILFAISPLVSEAFGEQKGEKAIGIFRSSLLVSLIISVIFTSMMFFAIANFDIIQQPKGISALAKRYLIILNLSTPAMMFFAAGRQLVDGMGRTLPGMTINIAALLLNILLNWLLIYGHWGFPALGIEGAVIASAIARVAMMLAIFIFIWRDKQIRALMKSYKQSVYKALSFV